MLTRSCSLAILCLSCACSSGDKKSAEGQGSEDSEVVAPPVVEPATAPGPGTHKHTAPVGHHAGHEHELDYLPCDADPSDPDAVLDLASTSFRKGSYAMASSCAELATDLVPHAVEAQHLRAAALAALGRFDDSQLAFAMALALDPDDPETLADAADFYINILPPKRRQSIVVGLEYARRGSERAIARRRLDRGLRGRLLLLEAEALNDLGSSDLALPRVEEAIALDPALPGAAHERAVCLFNLAEFDVAEQAFAEVVSAEPKNAYAHHHLGLIYERQGRDADARAHFEKAASLSPIDLGSGVHIGPEEFRAELAEAIAELPDELAEMMPHVEIKVLDVPPVDDLKAAEPPFSPTILGLFRGRPLGAGEEVGEGAHNADTGPRTIFLYRKNLARSVRGRDELDWQIRKTLRHELGHLEGFDEDELRRMGLE